MNVFESIFYPWLFLLARSLQFESRLSLNVTPESNPEYYPLIL